MILPRLAAGRKGVGGIIVRGVFRREAVVTETQRKRLGIALSGGAHGCVAHPGR